MANQAGSTTEELPQTLLDILNSRGHFKSMDLATEFNMDHQKLIGALKSLENFEELIKTEIIVLKSIELTDEGREIVKNGSHEFNVYKFVGEDGISTEEIKKQQFGSLGLAKAMQKGWIQLDKSTGKCIRKAGSVEDVIRIQLCAIQEGRADSLEKKGLEDLKKRKLITESSTKTLAVSKGSQFTTTLEKQPADLTAEMIQTGSWEGKQFKPYNFEALGIPTPSGHLHPLLKVRSEFRDIFFQMGFTEMDTSRYVESSFWNFDALFQPQQHPARDSHDTFFVENPKTSTDYPQDYMERVKMVHSKGGYGSKGYQYDWDEREAQKNILRTHTTAITARQLYKLAQEGFKPVKMFSIDRVFRNETLDATHLAEFHQVEGLIADRNLNLGQVIGLFTEFFMKCGIKKLMFKPAYNPYTEPSMEIFGRHPTKDKWMEIGNSGIFRPEMLLPMGLPDDVVVAGFGLSLERPTMIRYGIDNIRKLFGHKIDLRMIYENPICRLDQKKRIEK